MEQDLYRNRDFIPDFDAIMAETAARSREIASRVRVEADVVYGTGPRARMDILFPPRPAMGAPLHLFVHGGYWRSGSKSDHHLVAAPVLAVGGIAAVATYDLMPKTRLGPIVEQVRSAALHLIALAPTLGADPARFTVSGHSAGAHLATYLSAYGPQDLVRPSPRPLPAVRAALLVSGIYDLSGIPASFLKDEAEMTMEEAESWSPLSATHIPGPARIITRGARETAPFHDQARAFSGLLGRDRMPCTLREEPDLNHLSIVLALADPQSCLGGLVSEMVAG